MTKNETSKKDKSASYNCIECKNHETSSYLNMGEDTLCSHWCSKNKDMFKVYEEKYCDSFTQK